MRLADAAAVVRSKNAGIHFVTIDIMFEDPDRYASVRESGVLSAAIVADRIGIPESDVQFYEYPAGLAFKVTIPRSVSVSSPGDSDVFGAQQYAPVLDIDVPVE